MNSFGIALVWCVIQVSILASIVAVLYALTRRSGPSARALAAFAGLVLIVVLSALAFSPWPRWRSQAEFAGANLESGANSLAGEIASVGRDAEDETVSDEPGKTRVRSKTGVELSSPTAAFFETLVSELQRLPAPVENDSWRWQAYVAMLFLIGAGAGLVRLAAGLAVVRSYRLRARPIANASLRETADVLLAEFQAPRQVVLCESELLSTPATIGWLRPLIILPTDWKTWTFEESKTVLAHEIAHITRHDFATLIAAQLAVVLHFYHPLVHWLAARLRLEQELAADAAAARLTGGQRTYLTTLAGMALRQSDCPVAWPARTFLPTRGTFMRRIEMLRDETSVSQKMSPGMRSGIIAVMLTAGLGVAGLRGSPGNREVAAGQDVPPKAAAGQASRAARTILTEPGKSNPPGTTTSESSDSTSTSGTGGSGTGGSGTGGSGTGNSGTGNSGTGNSGTGRSGTGSSDGKSGTSATSTGAGGTSTTTATSAEPFSLAYVPRDAVVVAAVRPAALLNRPALAPVKNALAQQGELQKSVGVSPERIEQLIVAFVMDLPANGAGPAEPVPAGMVVHLAAAADAVALIKALQPNPEEQEYGGLKYVRGKTGLGAVCSLVDERTVVVCNGENHMRRLIVAGKSGASKSKWVDTWNGGAGADAAVLVSIPPFAELLNNVGGPAALGAKLGAFAPLWQAPKIGLLTAAFGDALKLELLLTTGSKDDAVKAMNTLQAAITLGQNSLSQVRSSISRQPGNDGAFFLGLIDTVDSLIDSIKITRSDDAGMKGNLNHYVAASAEMDAADAPKAFALLLPAIATARQAATRTQSMNNLKQLGLAMHNYHEANKSFPPAVLYGPDGKTPYSWRVALLPYLDQAALYEQYKKTEPWDSPDNKLVLAKMPTLFRDTGDQADSTFSSYFVLTGPATVFFGKEGCKINEITDGLSNTLMIVEAKRDIPWTKPEDIPYAAGAPFPNLGGHHHDIFLAEFCDGAVRALPHKIDPAQLHSLITRGGGEPVNWEALDRPPTKP